MNKPDIYIFHRRRFPLVVAKVLQGVPSALQSLSNYNLQKV